LTHIVAANLENCTVMPELLPPPYPADTSAKGWRFELDHEKIRKSDTWALAPRDVRPWLLMLWMVAWEQVPCGSLPNNDALIIARLEIAPKVYVKYRAVILSGWYLAGDDRLYHETITLRVMEMLKKRASDAVRSANRRARAAGFETDHDDDTDASRVTHGGLPCETDPSSVPSTKHQAPIQVEAKASSSSAAPTPPPCPHLKILALWEEVLPLHMQQLPSAWRGAKADALRARWREKAVDRSWVSEEQGIRWFRRFFEYIGLSRFLTGRRAPSRPDASPFMATLEWVVKQANWDKIVNGNYNQDADEQLPERRADGGAA
jgi:hypothetical protein